jgi:hypothetical protein
MPDASSSTQPTGSLSYDDAILLTPAWTAWDFAVLADVAKKLAVDVYELLAVIVSESHTLQPDARNPADPKLWPIAVGMNQITRVAAAALGLIPAETTKGSNLPDWKKWADGYVQAPVEFQLRVIQRYFQNNPYWQAKKSYPSGGKLYQANAASGTMFLPDRPDPVIATKGDGVYEGIAGLDFRGKNTVTLGDLQAAVDYQKTTDVFKAAKMRLDAAMAGGGIAFPTDA